MGDVFSLNTVASRGRTNQDTILVKLYFSVTKDEQARRFERRRTDPLRQWKLSPMDLQSRARWVEYSKAKDDMFRHTDIKQAPWFVVPSDDKRRARLNCISHLLSAIPYQDIVPDPVTIPEREPISYIRAPHDDQTFVEQLY